MPLADANLTVAIIAAAAAIFSAGGSIAAATIAWQLGLRRFVHERAQTDREDARASLAAGALALGQTKTVMRFAYGRFRGPLEQLGKEWPQDSPDWFSKLEDSVEDLEAMVATLRIRFDERNPVVRELIGALEDLRSLTGHYKRAWGSVFGTTRNRDALKDGEDGAVLNASFDNHKEAFLTAAQRTVGASLG